MPRRKSDETKSSVSQLLKQAPGPLRTTLSAARKLVREVAPDALEIAYGGSPPTSNRALWKLVRYAAHPDADDYAVGIGTYPDHVLIFFPRGRELDDGSGLLQGGGKTFRFISVRTPGEVNRPAVRKLVRGAFEESERRGNT